MKAFKTHYIVPVAILLGMSISSCNNQAINEEMNTPRAPKINKELVIHGHSRVDPWYWLNEREDTNVINYLEAENAYTKLMMAPTEGLQQKLYDEMIARLEQNDISVPYTLNGYSYYSRYEEGAEYKVYLRKKLTENAQEEVLLNGPALAEGHNYFHITGLSISPDNRYLAYGVDSVSRRQYRIYIKDLKTGEHRPAKIENTTGFAAWADDNATLFYTIKDASLRAFGIMKHRVNSPEEDTLVYQEKDARFSCHVYPSKSREYLIIASSSTLSDEYRTLRSDDPTGEFQLFQKRERGHEYSIDHAGDFFYIRTNWKATNFRLMRCKIGFNARSAWEELIPAREDVYVEGMELFRDYMVLMERKNGLVQLKVIPWKGGKEHYIEFWEETYFAQFGQNYAFDASALRFEYSSLTTPFSTYDYDLEKQSLELKKREKVLGDFDPANYKAERLYVTSHDGGKVPLSFVYRKDMFDTTSPMPTVLYGYGSYGYSLDPYFSSGRLSLLDRGFIFAIAHIRGGQEMGRQWYEDGKLLKKKNTFLDFIACGEELVRQGYTSPVHLYGIGGSAGGLLVGAVVNMRPDLFHGIVAQVPFVDVVTTMLDESIPLTTGEYDEWGNPTEKEYYDYMLSYSPYDNVQAMDYPAMLVTTGLHDSQVQYWEPAKWVAKLRDLKTDHNLLLLHTDMETGHGGASGRFSAYKDVARYYAFLLYLENIEN